MRKRIEAFKDHVREASSNPEFRHHAWFVEYHLEIVERIALELLDKYPEADSDLVMVLVWLHDYGKMLDFDNQYEVTLTAGRKQLQELGFDPDFVDRAISYVQTSDKKMEVDLHDAPIEVKILASADAGAHHVGPFFALWWWENPGWTPQELMQSDINKTMKDWDRKMVLPEVRQAFEARHLQILENAGQLPEHFLP